MRAVSFKFWIVLGVAKAGSGLGELIELSGSGVIEGRFTR